VCAHVVYVATKDLEGVTASKVSLNRGLLILELARGNKITLEQLREIVRRNGFTPREARVAVRGRLERANGGLRFLPAAGGDAWQAADAKGVAEAKEEALVEGTVAEREKGAAERVEITAVRAVPAP
jgi:hypothetical protein